MRLVSSRLTFYYKRVFPIIWIGGCIVVAALGVYGGLSNGGNISGLLPFAVILPVILMFGLFFIRKFVSDLVDEVWDDGSALVVKDRGQEQRVELADIKNVNYTATMNPPRVVLSLRRPTLFGDQIAFCAPMRFMPLTASPVINDLIDRVDQARESDHRH